MSPSLPWKQRGCRALTELLCAELTELSPSDALPVSPVLGGACHSFLRSSVLSFVPAFPWQSALARSSTPGMNSPKPG